MTESAAITTSRERSNPPNAVFRQELTPVTFLERSGEAHAERIAVVDGRISYTYKAWRERARQLASALQRVGLTPGDRVAFLALNSEPLLLAHFAVPMAGGVLVAINTRLSATEIDYILRHSGASILFVSRELRGSLPRIDGLPIVELGGELDSLIETGEPVPPAPIVDEYSTLSVNYTSGTTGRPKGVRYHHRGAHLNALAMALDHGLGPASSYLWTLPMFHCNGWCFPWALTAVGAKSICLPSVDPDRVWDLCAGGDVTHLCGAPTVLRMLAECPKAHLLRQEVRIVTAGAPPSGPLLTKMAAWNFRVDHVYGLTETYGPFTLNIEPPEAGSLSIESRARLRSRQGYPNVTSGEVRIVDANGQDVARDAQTLGEVVMRGNAVMSGYLDDEAATTEAFRDGWFHSGDLAVVHPDGQLELRDRIKDIIISGGENVSTIEVEQTIAAHDAVSECAVVGRPDPRWGEVPVAFVTLSHDSQISSEHIIAHCRERLAHFKCPRDVYFSPLPKSPTGKVLKTELRTRLAQPPTDQQPSRS
ncbi:MAG: AMP-binding protein [Solirubrobacteraceae bacterium]